MRPYKSGIPTGSIILWSGAVADIPNGFALCNGAGGRPDLRDKFIIGAGNSFAVDEVGGGMTHVHTFTGDGHVHAMAAGFVISAGEPLDYDVWTSPGVSIGTTDTGNNLPPYYGLCYIIKT